MVLPTHGVQDGWLRRVQPPQAQIRPRLQQRSRSTSVHPRTPARHCRSTAFPRLHQRRRRETGVVTKRWNRPQRPEPQVADATGALSGLGRSRARSMSAPHEACSPEGRSGPPPLTRGDHHPRPSRSRPCACSSRRAVLASPRRLRSSHRWGRLTMPQLVANASVSSVLRDVHDAARRRRRRGCGSSSATSARSRTSRSPWQRGEVCGLLGPNGAGKTTTLRVLHGPGTGVTGRARLFGTPVRARLAAAGPGRRAGRGGGVRAAPVGHDATCGCGGKPAAAGSRRRRRRRAGRRRPRRCDPPQGPHVLAGHEAAARVRPAAARPPGAAGARRADQRPRPGRDP